MQNGTHERLPLVLVLVPEERFSVCYPPTWTLQHCFSMRRRRRSFVCHYFEGEASVRASVPLCGGVSNVFVQEDQLTQPHLNCVQLGEKKPTRA